MNMECSEITTEIKTGDLVENLEFEDDSPKIVHLCRQSISEYHLYPVTPDFLSSCGGSDVEDICSSSKNSSTRCSPVQFSADPPEKTSDILAPVVIEMTRKVPSPTPATTKGESNNLQNCDFTPDITTTPKITIENVDMNPTPVEEEDEEIQQLTQKTAENGSSVPLNEFSPRSDETSDENETSENGRGVGVGEQNNPSLSPESFARKTMASPRPKSPRPVTPKKEDKDESFWDKIGTLGRKKRIKEVQEFEQEGKNAIDSPGSPTQFDIPPEDYDLAEGEERSLIERRSLADPKLQLLIGLLIDWINDELADQRIIVKSIEDDLYDGQILQKLLEKLTGQKLEVPEVSQSEEGQRHKLQLVLNEATQVVGLPRWTNQKWSVESIHSKSLVSILYLLVTLARHFRAPLRLPENVNVETVVVKKRNGKLEYRRVVEEITSRYDEFGMKCERDAFDTLLNHASDKLPVVKKSLISFVNKHLNKINLEVTDVENQFHDGVYLILLMGLLEGYFVPLFEFHLTPKNFEQKVFNVSFAFELMQDAGISKPKARPEDIVNLDLKSTLRVLYNLFAKYKNLN